MKKKYLALFLFFFLILIIFSFYPEKNDKYILSFIETDDRIGREAGYHFFQVMVNETVVFEEDIGAKENLKIEKDITNYYRFSTSRTSIAFRIYEKKGVDNYNITAIISNINLSHCDGNLKLNDFKFSKTNQSFSGNKGRASFSIALGKYQKTKTNDFAQWKTESNKSSPDLSVKEEDIKYIPSNPEKEKILVIEANISNLGDKDSGPFYVELYIDGKFREKREISLKRNSKKLLQFKHKYKENEDLIEIFIDKKNKIEEISKSNNLARKKILKSETFNDYGIWRPCHEENQKRLDFNFSVVWSDEEIQKALSFGHEKIIVGIFPPSYGWKIERMKKRADEINNLAGKYPHIYGTLIDDFWDNFNQKKINIEDLAEIKKRLTSNGRDLKLFMVIYENEVINHNLDVEKIIDGISFWISAFENNLSSSDYIEIIRDEFPGKEIIGGIYFGHSQPLRKPNNEQFNFLVKSYIQASGQQKIEGFCFFAGPLVDNSSIFGTYDLIKEAEDLTKKYYFPNLIIKRSKKDEILIQNIGSKKAKDIKVFFYDIKGDKEEMSIKDLDYQEKYFLKFSAKMAQYIEVKCDKEKYFEDNMLKM